MSATGSKRSDVHRVAVPAAAKPAHRVFGNDIYCCVDQGGNSYEAEEFVTTVCCLEPFIIGTSFQRVFLSATLAGAQLLEGDFGISMFIHDAGSNIIIVPTIQSLVPGEPKTITGAVDLAAGTYQFCLKVSATSFGSQFSWEEASLQAIVGQIVDTAQCFRTDGGGV